MLKGGGTHVVEKFQEKDASKIQISWLEKYNQKRAWNPNVCYGGGGGIHFRKDCSVKNQKCYNCKRIGHKNSHCRTKLRRSNVKNPRVLSAETKTDSQIRKFVGLKINGVHIKLQLEARSGIPIINMDKWKKIGKPI